MRTRPPAHTAARAHSNTRTRATSVEPAVCVCVCVCAELSVYVCSRQEKERLAHELDDDVLDDLAERGLHAVASQRRVDVGGELRDHLRVRLALERAAALLLRKRHACDAARLGGVAARRGDACACEPKS